MGQALTLHFAAETVEVTGNSLPTLCGKWMVGKPEAEDGNVRMIAKSFEIADFMTRIALAIGYESIEPAV